MKKMIPVYLIQLGILAAVLVIGLKVLQEVRLMRAEIGTVISHTGAREPAGTTPAIRVKVNGSIAVDKY